MDLVQDVVSHLAIDQEEAEAVIGAVLSAVQFDVDARTFEALKDALPQARLLLDRASARSARTSEIFALATPESLARLLRSAGHSEVAIRKLHGLMRDAILRTLPPDTAAPITDTIDRALP